MYSRLHSFGRKTNPSQISTLIIFSLQSVIFYTCTTTLLHDPQRITLICIFTISFALMILVAIWTGQIDPTDQITKAYIINRGQWQEFLRINQLKDCPQIVNCDKCSSKKQVYNAHCSVCQRCIENQDHHCAFLNTCIGQKNYKHFFLTIVLALTNLSIYIISFAIAMFNLHESEQYTLNTPEVIASIIGVIVVIGAWIAIAILFMLHIYLNVKGITTREWIHKGKVLSRTNTVKIRYFDMNQYHNQQRLNQVATLNQAQNIMPFQTGSTQSLPVSQNSTNRHAQLLNSTKTQNHTKHTHPQNTPSQTIQINTRMQQLSQNSKSNIQDISSLQQINQINEMAKKEELFELPIKRFDKQKDSRLNETQKKFIHGNSSVQSSQFEGQSHGYQDEKVPQKVKEQRQANKNNQECNNQKSMKPVGEIDQNPTQQPTTSKKGQKVRNFIIKNRVLSSLIGVSRQQFQNQANTTQSLNQQYLEHKSRFFKNHSVAVINQRPQSVFGSEKIILEKKRMKTVELDQNDIELEVQTNRQTSKAHESGRIKMNSRGTFDIDMSHASKQNLSDFGAQMTQTSVPQHS